MIEAAAPAENVRQGFTLIGSKLDAWANQFILLIPNMVVGLFAALLFVALAYAVAVLLRHSVNRAGRHDLAHMLSSFAFWCTIFGRLSCCHYDFASLRAPG